MPGLAALVALVALAVAFWRSDFNPWRAEPIEGFDGWVELAGDSAARSRPAPTGHPVDADAAGLVLARYRRIVLTEPLPTADALRAAAPIFVIDLDARAADPAMEELPESLRAASPDAARTLALVGCTTERSANYMGIAFGYAHRCSVVVADAAERRLIDAVSFTNWPPSSIRIPWDRVADRPDRQIAEYLAKLVGR